MRPLAALLFSLHLAIGAGGTVLDARLEAQSTDQAHFESERATACAPGHAHDACVLCRGESVASTALARTLLWISTAQRAIGHSALAVIPTAPAHSSGGGPRAPPQS